MKLIHECYLGWTTGYGPIEGHYNRSRVQDRETRFSTYAPLVVVMNDRAAYAVGLTGGMPHEVFERDQ